MYFATQNAAFGQKIFSPIKINRAKRVSQINFRLKNYLIKFPQKNIFQQIAISRYHNIRLTPLRVALRVAHLIHKRAREE